MNKQIDKAKGIIGLSLALAKAEFKLKNEGSYLGIAWYLLSPIITFALLYLIFFDRLGLKITAYPIYLFVGVIMFNVFSNITIEATRSITKGYPALIKSVYFRRETLILAIVIKYVFSHVFEGVLILGLLWWSQIALWQLLYYIPVAILFFLFLFGIALILASTTVYFADLDNVWNFATRIIWFITPIFYSIGGQTKLLYLNLLNPLYYFISLARELIIDGRLSHPYFLVTSVLIAFMSYGVGSIAFSVLNKKIAELV